jgi:hypothetical protein
MTTLMAEDINMMKKNCRAILILALLFPGIALYARVSEPQYETTAQRKRPVNTPKSPAANGSR